MSTATVFTETDESAIADLLVGHRITKVSDDELLLDDGTRLKLVGNDGGCACDAGCYDLKTLNGCDNVVTKVELVNSPTGDHLDGDGTYSITITPAGAEAAMGG